MRPVSVQAVFMGPGPRLGTLGGMGCVKMDKMQFLLNPQLRALAGVAPWTECRPADRKVDGLIPCQGSRLGCGQGLKLEGAQEAIDRYFLSLSFFLPPSLSKNK